MQTVVQIGRRDGTRGDFKGAVARRGGDPLVDWEGEAAAAAQALRLTGGHACLAGILWL